MFKLCIFLLCFLIFNVESHHDDCDDSSDSDSDSHEHGGHGHGHGHGHGGRRWTRPNRGCGNGWIGFNRPTGRWCFKAFSGIYQQELPEDKCAESQATLSAFMNPAEQQAINDDALKAIAPRTTGSIWIGLRRTGSCMNQGQTAQCTALNSFYYTDGSTTGTAGLVWDPSQNQPDNSINQACVGYFAAPTAGQSLQHGVWFWLTQKLDDQQCDLSANKEGPRKIVGYLCGRKAQ